MAELYFCFSVFLKFPMSLNCFKKEEGGRYYGRESVYKDRFTAPAMLKSEPAHIGVQAEASGHLANCKVDGSRLT